MSKVNLTTAPRSPEMLDRLKLARTARAEEQAGGEGRMARILVFSSPVDDVSGPMEHRLESMKPVRDVTDRLGSASEEESSAGSIEGTRDVVFEESRAQAEVSALLDEKTDRRFETIQALRQEVERFSVI